MLIQIAIGITPILAHLSTLFVVNKHLKKFIYSQEERKTYRKEKKIFKEVSKTYSPLYVASGALLFYMNKRLNAYDLLEQATLYIKLTVFIITLVAFALSLKYFVDKFKIERLLYLKKKERELLENRKSE